MRHRSASLLVLFCAIAVADEPGKLGGSLGVYLKHERALDAGVLQAIEREVEAAVALSGIEIAWQDGLRPEVFDRVAVIRLRGECRPDAPLPVAVRLSGADGEPLGQTQVVDRKILPMADVQCDAVRKLVDRDLQAAPAADRDELLGRALGRVTAHELYHILLHTRRHGREGFAKPAQTSAELLTPGGAFAGVDRHRLSESASGDVTDSADETGR
jgi:hypothetical protein